MRDLLSGPGAGVPRAMLSACAEKMGDCAVIYSQGPGPGGQWAASARPSQDRPRLMVTGPRADSGRMRASPSFPLGFELSGLGIG